MIDSAPQAGRRLGVEVLDTWSFDASRLRINKIKAPDAPHLHNHPWEWCWALILSGGYVHEFAYLQPDGSLSKRELRAFRPGDVNFMPHSLFHRIAEVEPETYTQIFWGPDIPDCKHVTYWTPEGLKAQRQMQDYLAAK
jgi:hypothetical protein